MDFLESIIRVFVYLFKMHILRIFMEHMVR